MLTNNIALFIKIVELGSLTAAGREVGLSPTTVSERLSALENHYGVVLLNRTTRAISLTEEGRMLLEGAKEVLDGIADLELRIKTGAHKLSGSIRVSAPSGLGRTFVSNAVANFIEINPGIHVELLLSDGFVDIVGEGIDIAVRFGTVTNSTLRVKSIGEKRRVLCAAPTYLQKNKAPEIPADLKKHNCLIMRFGRTLDNVWRFGKGQKQHIVTVSGDRVANDGALVHQWCLSGYGIMLKSELDVGADLKSGKLIELLPYHASPAIPLQLIFPPGRAQPRRVRVLAAYLQKTLGNICHLP